MTKTELEEAIKNGKSVWVAQRNKVFELCPDMSVKISNSIEPNKVIATFEFNDNAIIIKNKLVYLDLWFHFENILRNKLEAEHHAFHKGITRTEQLPFLTWKEFLKEYSFDFYCENHEWFTLYWNDGDGIVLESIDGLYKKIWDLTEENFYKAYDECVKLFKGE